jgi:hypothetical protein
MNSFSLSDNIPESFDEKSDTEAIKLELRNLQEKLNSLRELSFVLCRAEMRASAGVERAVIALNRHPNDEFTPMCQDAVLTARTALKESVTAIRANNLTIRETNDAMTNVLMTMDQNSQNLMVKRSLLGGLFFAYSSSSDDDESVSELLKSQLDISSEDISSRDD